MLLGMPSGGGAAALLLAVPHLKKPEGALEATPASTSGSWLAALLLHTQGVMIHKSCCYRQHHHGNECLCSVSMQIWPAAVLPPTGSPTPKHTGLVIAVASLLKTQLQTASCATTLRLPAFPHQPQQL